jgi:hypothetical protein
MTSPTPAPAPKPWSHLPKEVLAADGLLVAAHVAWPHGPLTQWWSAVLVVAGLALVAAVQLRPELVARIPWPPVRAHPEVAALVLLLIVGSAGAEPSLGAVAHLAGVFLLWRSWRTGTVGEYLDPASAWRSGWLTRGVLAAFVLCIATMAIEWVGAFSNSYNTTVGDWVYTNTYATDAESGWDLGEAPFLGLLLSGVALWLLIPTVRAHRLGRWLPVAGFGGAAARAAVVAWEDWRHVEELHDIGGSYPQFQAAGPVFFAISAVVGMLLSLVVIRRLRRAPGPAGGVAG